MPKKSQNLAFDRRLVYCDFVLNRAYYAPLFFFFQAEDGIRDGRVTGVQTCALPISAAGRVRARGVRRGEHRAPALVDAVGEEVAQAAVLAGGDAPRAALADVVVLADRPADRVGGEDLRRWLVGADDRRAEGAQVGGLAAEVGEVVGLIPDDVDLAGVAGDRPRPQDAPSRGRGDRQRLAPVDAQVGRVDHLDLVRRRARAVVAAARRVLLARVVVVDHVEAALVVERDRGPVRVRAALDALDRDVLGEGGVAALPRADQELAALLDGLDEHVARAVVEQLAVAAGVRDPGRRAGAAAIGRLEDLVAASVGVGGHEDLVLLAAGQPRAVAVVALGRAAVPRLAAVGRREDRVVDEVDAGVVDASAGVLGEVGVREAGVLRRRVGEARAEQADLLPRLAAVRGRPVVDLVAVAAEPQERRLGRQADAVDVRRALVAGVDDRVVDRVGRGPAPRRRAIRSCRRSWASRR